MANIGQSLYVSKKAQSKATAELTFIGEKKVDKTKIQHYRYHQDEVKRTMAVKDLSFFDKDSGYQHWLNYHGIHDVSLIKKVGDAAHLDR